MSLGVFAPFKSAVPLRRSEKRVLLAVLFIASLITSSYLAWVIPRGVSDAVAAEQQYRLQSGHTYDLSVPGGPSKGDYDTLFFIDMGGAVDGRYWISSWIPKWFSFGKNKAIVAIDTYAPTFVYKPDITVHIADVAQPTIAFHFDEKVVRPLLENKQNLTDLIHRATVDITLTQDQALTLDL